MSDAFYQELLVEVNQTIAEFGTQFPIRNQGVFNNETLTVEKPEPRFITGLVSDAELLSGLGGKSENNAKAWIGKKVLIMQANANPLQGDEVQVDGRWFPLSKVKEIKPANVNLLYILDISI